MADPSDPGSDHSKLPRLAKWPRWVIAGALAALVLWQASSCCCLGGAVTPAMTPFPVSEDLAHDLRERFNEAKSTKGPFTFEFSDQELTAYIVSYLQSGPGEFPARDMQAQFQDGYVDIWATFIDVAPTDVPAYVQASVQAVDGEAVFYITQANAGPFPVPGAMRETISQSLGESLAELQLGLAFDHIQISPGTAIISGRVVGDVPDLP